MLHKIYLFILLKPEFFLLAGGRAEHHRWQCFPHGVRGAASAPTDPPGCNLVAINADLSQRQTGASNFVGMF